VIRAALRAAALLAALVGCTAQVPLRESLTTGQPASIELVATPFFPQEDHQCGPAALATTLAAAGVAIEPDTLVPQVFLAGRQGSLQADLMGAARRHERLPYPLAPGAEPLLAELVAGYPVLVLQNLATRQFPQWHYAVLVGYDADRGTAILRSGGEPRVEMRWARFMATLERADHWSVVVLEPGRLPATAQPRPYVAAAAGLEAAGQLEAARAAYAAATARWPGEPLAWLGLGNVAHATGDLEAALEAYARATRAAPANPAARINLAQALLEYGCPARALAEAQQAEALAAGTALAPVLARLLENTTAATGRGVDAAHCAGPVGADPAGS
jgi:hypothetical protein